MTTRVLFLSPPEYHNPPFTVCRDIIHNLDRAQVTPFVVVDDAAEHPGVPADVRVDRFAMASGLRRARRAELQGLLALVQAVPGLIDYVRRNQIDIIHVNDNLPSVTVGTPLARATGAKLLIHYHSVVASTVPSRFEPVRLKALSVAARMASLNVGCSRHVSAQVKRLLGPHDERIATVLNGVDVARFHPSTDRRLRAEYGFEPEHVVVLQLARLQKQKRPEDLIRAMALAKDRAPNLRALLVGWTDPRYFGPFADYRAELEDLVRRTGLKDRVVFGAPRPEAPELHAASDIGVLASELEAFGLVVAESMAAGRPFIGSDAGGIPESIEDGKTGYVYPLGAVEALADRLVELSQDAALRARMGERGRQRAVELLSSERLGREFSALYRAVAGGESAPAPLRFVA